MPSSVHLDRRHSIKVQLNQGARGCFPIHVDSDLQYSGRVLSSILYLNDWKEADGGEARRMRRRNVDFHLHISRAHLHVSILASRQLTPHQLVLYPFPFEKVMIPPTHNRLVVFSSAQMLHRVMPNRAAERVCLTVWHSKLAAAAAPATLASALPALAAPVLPNERHDAALFRDQVLAYLLHPRHRLHVAKLFYAAETRTSIFEAHHESIERQRLLDAQSRDVERLRKYFAPFVEFIENEFPIRDAAEQSRILQTHGHLLQWF